MGAVGNVVVGLTFFILLLALIASAVVEAIGGMLRLRAAMLDRTLRAILTGIWPKTRAELAAAPRDERVRAFLSDPRGSIGYPGRFNRSQRPAYLATDRFVDLVFAHYLRPGTPHPLDVDRAVDSLDDVGIGSVLRRLWADADRDVEVLRHRLADFYDGTMNRVSGWYRRRSRWMLFGVGAVLAVGMNVNVFTTGRLLWSSPAVSDAVRAAAEQQAAPTGGDVTAEVANAVTAYRQAADSGLPFGWGNEAQPEGSGWLSAIAGWLMIAGAVSLGAPFWFDVLGRFVNVRLAGSPPRGGSRADDPSTATGSSMGGRTAAPRASAVPAGEPLPAGQARTDFDPKVHGFHFDNDFVNQYRIPFGASTVTTYGRCGGMVYAALDLYGAGATVPSTDDVPPDASPLARYLLERLIDSWLNPSATRFVTWTPKDDATLAVLTATEIETICASLDLGQPTPVGLIGGRTLGEVGRNHQVLAIGYRRDENGTTEIDLYDNNHHDVVTMLTHRPGAYGLTSSNRTRPWRAAFAHTYTPKRFPEDLGAVIDVRADERVGGDR